MGSHNIHAKKEGKKKKKGGDSNTSAFSSKPVFVAPTVIKKDRENNY